MCIKITETTGFRDETSRKLGRANDVAKTTRRKMACMPRLGAMRATSLPISSHLLCCDQESKTGNSQGSEEEGSEASHPKKFWGKIELLPTPLGHMAFQLSAAGGDPMNSPMGDVYSPLHLSTPSSEADASVTPSTAAAGSRSPVHRFFGTPALLSSSFAAPSSIYDTLKPDLTPQIFGMPAEASGKRGIYKVDVGAGLSLPEPPPPDESKNKSRRYTIMSRACSILIACARSVSVRPVGHTGRHTPWPWQCGWPCRACVIRASTSID